MIDETSNNSFSPSSRQLVVADRCWHLARVPARSAACLLALLLAACAPSPIQPAPGPATPPAPRTQPAPDAPPPVLRPGDLNQQAPVPANTAVDTLLARAGDLADRGDSDAALAAAERALRLAPRDPRIYYRLAQLRLQRGERSQAEQLALKGLSLGPDSALRDALERVLKSSRGA